ncbi:calmodulin-binding protein 60 D [Trifolium repens]|nr:calmodulin-binding protein 60 D [Trifolium repens]
MAAKRTSHDDDSTKNLHVPSTKRIKHHDDIFAFSIVHSLRKVVREVIPPMFDRYLAPSRGLTLNSRVNPYGRRGLQLCFKNNLPQRNYTDSKIKAEGGEPLRIELRDAENQHIVRGEGSSMRIQICVLHGDFGNEDWTAEEFDKQIVIPRERNGALLKGDTIITLKDGVAYINNMEFTDISKGRTKEFRLGAKIVRSNSIGSDIREGRSEPFRVWHLRGKANEKHGRPSMNDEVWRLKGIGKNGKFHTELGSHGIKSVKDFLQLYKTNEASLREKIGKITEKSWNTIIAHVKECDVDDDDEHAYKNLNDLKQMPIDTTIHGLVETSTGVQTAQYGGLDQTLQQFDFPIAQQGLLNTDPTSFNLSEMWPSTLISQSDMVALGEMAPYLYGEGNMLSGLDEVSQTGQFGRSFSMEKFNANLLSFVYGDGAGPSNHSSSSNFAEHTSSKVKLKKDWQKIRSALKWFMLYVDVSRKREQFVFIYTP